MDVTMEQPSPHHDTNSLHGRDGSFVSGIQGKMHQAQARAYEAFGHASMCNAFLVIILRERIAPVYNYN
eukprot:1160341-Pelagomonas_calceolata.AAC.6